jgi:putative redox protein
VVSIDEAVGVFTAARHPGSFIALAGVDHAIAEERQAGHVAALIPTWAEPYLPDLRPDQATDEATDDVVVTEAGTGRYAQRITAGRHVLTADEPTSIGGEDTGPNPYDLLLAALGACTSMTLRMSADRKGLQLQRTTVPLRHDHVHAKDCANVEQNTGTISRISASSTSRVRSPTNTVADLSRSPTAALCTGPSAHRSRSRPLPPEPVRRSRALP